MNIHGDAWFSSESDPAEYWAEGVKCQVEVELTDQDEVRVGIYFAPNKSDTATVYLSRANADKLARFLSAASVADLELVRA